MSDDVEVRDNEDEMETVDASAQAPSARTAFPLTRGRVRGYDPAAVDAFLSRARATFEVDGPLDAGGLGAAGDDGVRIDAALVRAVAFPLVKRGYAIEAVDAALGRIEDAFANRERQAAISRDGAQQWVDQARDQAQEILDRLSRAPRHRFRRAGWLRFGYRLDEVDLVADKLRNYLESGFSVTPDQVRGAAFRMQRRGYDEAQVDAVLDAVVDVMLAVR